jgi:histidine triad (HIT) family protein
MTKERQGMDGMACIFCDIVSANSPSKVIYRDDLVTAFRDTHPIASTHILVISNRHIASASDLQPEDEALAGHMLLVAVQLARETGIAEPGYRLLINSGRHGGQSVFHLHLHLIGGRLTRFVVQ